jgi:hypothetical protein
MNTNLIEIYVSEVGRRLPKKNRTDIEAEIRSILQDMLDERSQKSGKPVDEGMILEVLKVYGSPEKVAGTYFGDRYLIGPQLYPTFILVLRILITVFGILAAIGLGVAIYPIISNAQNTYETILRAIANLGVALFFAFGSIVFIFAILEWALFRAGVKVEIKGLPNEKEWNPHSLTKLSLPNQVKMGETILEILACFAAIVIFNFFPEVIGFGYGTGGTWYIGAGNWTFVPLLSKVFYYYVPYLTIVWVLTVILDIVLLRMGHWNITARIGLIGLKLTGILIAVLMLNGPSLLAITVGTLTAFLGNADWANSMMPILSQLVHLVLWLTIILGSLDVVRLSYRMVTGRHLPRVIPDQK